MYGSDCRRLYGSDCRRLIDVTLPLWPGHPPWPGDIPFQKEPSSAIAQGDPCNVSRLEMSSHFGTHLDAPSHFETDGLTLEQLPLEVLIGPALVHEVRSLKLIEPDDLPVLEGIERLLFKTKNSERIADREFHTD